MTRIMKHNSNIVEPLVAIRCITYNHEPYRRDALKEFVMQKTNFPFVAIVHDDASANGTRHDAIIRPGGGSRNPFTKDSLKLKIYEDGRTRHDMQIHMKRMDEFAFGITTAPRLFRKLSKKFGIEYLDADYFAFHQINRKMNETTYKKLKKEPKNEFSEFRSGFKSLIR